eukprot:345036-Amphidinium_carterae.1
MMSRSIRLPVRIGSLARLDRNSLWRSLAAPANPAQCALVDHNSRQSHVADGCAAPRARSPCACCCEH